MISTNQHLLKNSVVAALLLLACVLVPWIANVGGSAQDEHTVRLAH